MKTFITFDRHKKILLSDEPSEEFNIISNKAKEDNNHSLYKNYKNLDLSQFLIYQVFLQDNIPVGFQGTMSKPFYNGSCRIFSRYYIDPTVRGFNNNKWFLAESAKICLHQINPYLNSNLFASRQVKKTVDGNAKQTAAICKTLNRITDCDIRSDDFLYRVAHPPSSKDSWQHIMWFKDMKPNLEKITVDEYKKRFNVR